MNKMHIATFFAGLSITSGAVAGERFEINNIYPINEEQFQLRDSRYFLIDNQGYYEVVEGPLSDGSARCLGGGEYFIDGTNTASGICVFEEDEGTFTIRWKGGQQGTANTWDIVAGTGKFDGMTGTGIATTGVEIMYRAMPLRQTHIVGTVDIPSK